MPHVFKNRLIPCVHDHFIQIVFVLFLFWWPMLNVLVECTTLHLWRGKVIYYSGSETMSLQDAMILCSKHGGSLPSVHSEEDVDELINLIGGESRLWLGAKPKDNRSPTGALDSYEWLDGTPFDYKKWVADSPDCMTQCCGVGVSTIYDHGLVDIGCHIRRKVVCLMPVMTKESAQAWINDHVANLTSSINMMQEFTKNSYQMSVDLLNETMILAQQESISFLRILNRLEGKILRSIRMLNESIINNELQINQIAQKMNQSLSEEAQQASQVGYEQQVNLESISYRISVCFIFLAFIFILILLVFLCETNLIPWSSICESNVYFIDNIHSRIENWPKRTETLIPSEP